MPHRRWKIIACLFLVVATLAVYGDLRTHQFINYDDNVYVTDNPTVQGGLTLSGLIGAFTSTCAGLWHPLTMLSQMLDCQLFGLHPGGLSPHQFTLPHCQHPAVISVAPADHRGLGTQFPGGRPLCPAPPARGVSGLGGRTEGCPEHLFLAAHHVGLRLVRGVSGV